MMFCDLGKPRLCKPPALQLTLAKACHLRTLLQSTKGGFDLAFEVIQELMRFMHLLDSVIDMR